MSKHFIVSTITSNQVHNHAIHTAIVKCHAENWSAEFTTMEEDKRNVREASLITITLPDRRKAQFTVQDLMALPSILANAQAMLTLHAEDHFDDKGREGNVLDCISELNGALKLFTK